MSSYKLPLGVLNDTESKKRLGSDLDVAIAVQNHELTEAERDDVLSAIAGKEKYLKLSLSAKDYFNQKLYLVWLIGRLGVDILIADAGVLKLIKELCTLVESEYAELENQEIQTLTKGCSFLLDLGFETENDKKLGIGEELFKLVESYTNRLSFYQEEFVKTLDEMDEDIPGCDAAKEYLGEYRVEKLEEIHSVEAKFKEIVWQ